MKQKTQGRIERYKNREETTIEDLEEIKKEIRQIINKMKKKKAAGEDGIPNEAWIY